MPAEINSNTDVVKSVHGINGYAGGPITETIANGFFTVDDQWTVKYWNKAAEQILGIPAEAIVGKNLWDKFSGIIPIDFYAVYHKAFLLDVPAHFEEYWGEMEAWFDVITYHCDNTLSVSFKSISQPKDPEYARRQLKVLNELYKLVTEVTNDCLWEWDLQTREIFWIDGGHKRVFGYQIENALIPQDFWESRLHPDDRVRVLAKLSKTIMEWPGCIWEDEYRFKRANGDYAYVCDRGHIIFDDERTAVRMIGATQDVSSRKLTEIKLLQERVTRQNEITSAVLTAQERERENIGRELHDNLNQILVAAKMHIEFARKHEVGRDAYLVKSSDYIVEVIEEIRKISKTLAIPGKFIGLIDSIRNLLADLNQLHPIKIVFHKANIDDDVLDLKIQVDIFRIIQEQLNNILKHAHATYASISLARRTNEIILVISDNGRGCDVLMENSGVGIVNIRSRAELYSGTVTIASRPGEGYELKVLLPLG